MRTETEGSVLLPGTERKPGTVTRGWLISFGDLLTLLLCFFLSIIGLGPLNPNHKTPNNNATSRNHDSKYALATVAGSLNRDGIGIASSSSEQEVDGVAITTLSQLDISNRDFPLEPHIVAKIQEQSVVKASAEMMLSVEICRTAVKEESLLSVISALDRQIIDTGWSAGFRLRIVESPCLEGVRVQMGADTHD